MALVVVALVAALAGFLGGSRGAAPTAAGARCHISGSGDLTRPDDKCTPGAFDAIPLRPSRPGERAVCEHKARPSIAAAEKRRIARQYGYRSWTGRDGELDHRVPFFLGGRTVEDNLWPERGSIPNAKDRVERAVYERVCVSGTMTAATGRAVFLGDWTKAR
jgi:hypothetical protein